MNFKIEWQIIQTKEQRGKKNEDEESLKETNPNEDKYKKIHKQTHHSKKAESQRQGENCKSNKRKMICCLTKEPQ